MKEMEPIARRRVRNRILAVMAHTARYSIRGQARLAEDAGVSRSAVCRFLPGQANPSFALVMVLIVAKYTLAPPEPEVDDAA